MPAKKTKSQTSGRVECFFNALEAYPSGKETIIGVAAFAMLITGLSIGSGRTYTYQNETFRDTLAGFMIIPSVIYLLYFAARIKLSDEKAINDARFRQFHPNHLEKGTQTHDIDQRDTETNALKLT